MNKRLNIKTRDVLIVLGILVAILIGISTQWALAGEMIYGAVVY